MAEQVNQRIEDMINELEQMRRTSLYDDEEIKEISSKRKEFEYKIQRRVKQKEDYVQYIVYELALLEDISLRRKIRKFGEKKKDIEYAIAKRLNKLFKQFIYRFQNDIEIYFEYIKFCKGVGFDYAVSGIIGQMLQFHGDKPKMWLLASRWESQDQNNLETARNFLLKGIHRHPDSDTLYLELFEIEIMQAFKIEDEAEKEKQLKRADVVWRNGAQNVKDISFLFRLCNLALKYETSISKNIKQEIWSKREHKEVWTYVAAKELEGCHWEDIEEFVDDKKKISRELNNYIAVYEEALKQFSDKTLCTKYIYNLLGLSEAICTEYQKIFAVKHAWKFGHENGLLTDDMYTFGIELLKLENDTSREEMIEILDKASKLNPQAKPIWLEKLQLSKSDVKKTLSILQEATKALNTNDAIALWEFVLDNVDSKESLQNLYKRFQKCENAAILSVKPKLLQKMYHLNGVKAARAMYEDLIRTPPTQMEVHKVMIEIEKSQHIVNLKNIRKCYECAVQHHGSENIDLWIDYMKAETENGNAQATPALYRRAVGQLKKELVDEFIKAQTLAKLK